MPLSSDDGRSVLSGVLRGRLEVAVVAGRRVAEGGVRAAFASLGVAAVEKPGYLDDARAGLRRGLRAKQRQLGGDFEVLVWDAAYEQWHRLLFARFLAENGLLLHPQFKAAVTLEECGEFAAELGEPNAWSVAARFAAEILPGIFRLEDPRVRLRLAAEHRLALERIVSGLPVEVFTAEDSLGWVYQYWQSERKDAVNASEVKIGGADLGPVTQLFTENYMVRFLLENSLGAWWAARHPGSPLLAGFEYLRLDDEGVPAAGGFEQWPERVAEVTVMDPCCGSGHFLVEAFALLWRMRAEEEGLDSVAAQDAVLRENLFGLELDPRCVQIAMFAVALAAWKQGGGWRELPTPNIACSGIPVKASLGEWTGLAKGDARLEGALARLHGLFKDADTLGSLIDPRRATEGTNASGSQRSLEDVDYDEIAPLLQRAAARETTDPATAVLGADAAAIARAATLLSRAYTLITTNVPYLGMGGQSALLRSLGNAQFADTKADLATMFLDRWAIGSPSTCSSSATVTPQTWLYLRWYTRLRERVLEQQTAHLICRLGSGAFTSISGEVVQAALTVLSASAPADDRSVLLLDASTVRGQDGKAQCIKRNDLECAEQGAMLRGPHSVIAPPGEPGQTLLSDLVTVHYGTKPGQTQRVKRNFWELPNLCDPWVRLESRPLGTPLFSGKGEVITAPKAAWQAGVTELGIRGSDAWGRPGIVISKMTSLPTSIYCGEIFDDNTYVLIPRATSDLSTLLSFVRSADFSAEVRRRNQKLAIDTSAMISVPLNVERWRAVAEVEFPDGLPQPWSDDPTQWLFEGRPEVTSEPLQVGVGRLLGYSWPEQPESDDLSGLADADGIVCVPPVGGEAPAADRLQQLLVQAYGNRWSAGSVRELLEAAGSKKNSLGDWVRDDFFAHHCKVFGNRPFVWHIWDGRPDGFAALVNCHRLDRAGLEKLTYTYLGDWLERQRADAAEGVTGADVRLAAATALRAKLEAILEGEPPYDIYVRWKPLHKQPMGWEPDLDDGVRLNLRPFVTAGVLRSRVNVHWKKDRGKNPDGSDRHNDLHYTRAEKQHARKDTKT